MSGFRLSSQRLNLLLILIAAIGWIWALSQKLGPDLSAEANERAETGSAKSERRGQRTIPERSLASAMANPRTAQMIAGFDGILAAARPGEVNQALVDACRGALTDLDFEARVRDFSLLVEAMRPEDASAIHELFLELHREDGRGLPMEYAAFSNWWGQIDPEGALGYLASEVPLRMPENDVRNILGGWAENDPAAALQWALDHPEHRLAVAGAIGGWMRYDRDAATAYLTSGEAPMEHVPDGIAHGAMETLYDLGSDASAEWIASLPDDGIYGAAAAVAWDRTSREYSELPYEKAARILSHVREESWFNIHQLERFTHGVAGARCNDQGRAGLVEALAETWPADQAAAQFERWNAQDPRLAQAWLEQAPDHPWAAEILASLPQLEIHPPPGDPFEGGFVFPDE